MSLDVERLLAELTLEEKAALVSGRDFWHTVPVDRLGIPSIMCADGPHGLRAQMEGHDHGGLLGSVPATCFIALICAAEPTRLTDRPTLIAGRMP